MHTVGEILKKARLEKRLELEDIEKVLKIRKKYLLALEENDWNKLPSLPYIKGFLRNYAGFLGLKKEEMVAIFRRQFQYQEKEGLMPKGLTSPLNEPVIRFTPQLSVAIIIVSFFLVFFGYLFYQYKIYTSPPNLIITKPLEGETVYTEKVVVEGTTDADAVLSINGQKIAVSTDGKFNSTLSLSPGINTINFESTSKYGKKKSLTRTIQIQP